MSGILSNSRKCLRQIVESPIDEYISAETNHPNYNISTFFSSEFFFHQNVFSRMVNYPYFFCIIFLLCILLIEFHINSMADKCNIYYVVDVLHLDDLFLLICIRLLDFPIFV